MKVIYKNEYYLLGKLMRSQQKIKMSKIIRKRSINVVKHLLVIYKFEIKIKITLFVKKQYIWAFEKLVYLLCCYEMLTPFKLYDQDCLKFLPTFKNYITMRQKILPLTLINFSFNLEEYKSEHILILICVNPLYVANFTSPSRASSYFNLRLHLFDPDWFQSIVSDANHPNKMLR